MTELLIAIVGSADPERKDYDPPLKNAGKAKEAAALLGSELAKAGHRIIVYSSDPKFIEADFVRGYTGSGAAKENSIVLRYPGIAGPFPYFPERDDEKYRKCFQDDPDESPNWQVCFYSSLKKADAVLLIGGASSALITFLMAEIRGITLLPIGTFGGSARTVWGLASKRFDDSVRAIAGADQWKPESAGDLVRALAGEHARVAAERKLNEELAGKKHQADLEQQRRARVGRQSLVSGAFLLAAVLLGLGGTFGPIANPLYFGAFFLLTPLVAGGAGGLGRNLLDFYRGTKEEPGHTPAVSFVLGAMAGFIAAALFAAAQWASQPDIKAFAKAIPDGLRLLVLFELVIALLSGFMLDSLFRQWEKDPPQMGGAQ